MNEKEIIKGNLKDSKKIKKYFNIFCLIIFIFILFFTLNEANQLKERFCVTCNEHDYIFQCAKCQDSVFNIWFAFGDWIYSLIIIVIYVITMLFVKFIWDPIELTITNKRVYGKAAFGKRVDLPLDSISSIGVNNLFKSVSIATSSGRVTFNFLSNHKEVYDEISKLLIKRQDEKPQKKKEDNSDYIEELKKLKELLNDGIITQEEFDKKKKELL